MVGALSISFVMIQYADQIQTGKFVKDLTFSNILIRMMAGRNRVVDASNDHVRLDHERMYGLVTAHSRRD